MIEFFWNCKLFARKVWGALLTLLILNEGDIRVYKTRLGFGVIATHAILDDAPALLKGFAFGSCNSPVLPYPFG